MNILILIKHFFGVCKEPKTFDEVKQKFKQHYYQSIDEMTVGEFHWLYYHWLRGFQEKGAYEAMKRFLK